ncbi:MAG: 4-hydroxy-3-methylbut-2-enyl diphosphate reductase [Spirochaetaceae bacterium]|jgi:4-hydroxy-3-methylbut-2-enyl diphosphate reductase|nr:4-hydroxy-3-methylbut-2-enyl diphosphate reductase [Spirochaetaceae bacterium]
MEIIKADIMGYCMGVRRAVESAEQSIKDFPHKNIYTLGPLIHNQNALDNLEQKGVRVLKLQNDKFSFDIDENSVVIVRAHGVAPQIIKLLEKTGCTIINATCPRVLSNQKRAADFAKRQFAVIIAGDKNHGEVTGLEGFVKEFCSECYVIENTKDAEILSNQICQNSSINKDNIVLLSQTTISATEYESIGKVLKEKFPSIQILNTICPATTERQEALKKLCAQVDGVVVIGGKSSANTCRLFSMAQDFSENPEYRCKFACHIENPCELPKEFFSLEVVGLTAGASTPDEVILSVEKSLYCN